MTVRTAERRRSVRMAAAYPAAVLDRRGRLLVRGRTADISESGVLIVVDARAAFQVNQEIVVELSLPATSEHEVRRGQCRLVQFRSRVARLQDLGNLRGLGVEFVERM